MQDGLGCCFDVGGSANLFDCLLPDLKIDWPANPGIDRGCQNSSWAARSAR